MTAPPISWGRGAAVIKEVSWSRLTPTLPQLCSAGGGARDPQSAHGGWESPGVSAHLLSRLVAAGVGARVPREEMPGRDSLPRDAAGLARALRQ